MNCIACCNVRSCQFGSICMSVSPALVLVNPFLIYNCTISNFQCSLFACSFKTIFITIFKGNRYCLSVLRQCFRMSLIFIQIFHSNTFTIICIQIRITPWQTVYKRCIRNSVCRYGYSDGPGNFFVICTQLSFFGNSCTLVSIIRSNRRYSTVTATAIYRCIVFQIFFVIKT